MRYLVHLYEVPREKNTTSASTKTALCAINSFHEQHRMPSPRHSFYVKMLLKSSKRALGTRGTQKKALLDEDLKRLYARFVAPDPTFAGNLAMMLQMAICQEGLLRYDELSDITFADIVITEVALLVFFTESKTEKERKSLWLRYAGMRRRGRHTRSCLPWYTRCRSNSRSCTNLDGHEISSLA